METGGGEDQQGSGGWEDKAANVLNAVMVMAIGLAVGVLGVWALWRFAVVVRAEGFGRNTDWVDLGYAAMFLMVSAQALRWGGGMLRPRPE